MDVNHSASLATLFVVNAALASAPAAAQAQSSTNERPANVLEEIMVTAQKRSQSIQDVPVSISTLSGEQFESLFSGGEDILALATRVPGLYVETSNGRVAPRFYLRGLGNTDFDLAASQPVSIVMDDVVKENVILKSFPLFDVAQVEVMRGPQGTVFGRNTTAGTIKIDSVRPSQEFDAFAEVGVGNLGTLNFEGAIGGKLSDSVSGRFALLSQNRDDWIDNGFTGDRDVMGGFSEQAWRGQLLWQPTDNVNALFMYSDRDLDGTSTMFRANALSAGSNDFNGNYDRDQVFYDQGDNNVQKYESSSLSVKLEIGFDDLTFTSITALDEADGRGIGDIDGGSGSGATSFPGFIPFTAVTEDQLQGLEQLTQEFRLASDVNEALRWQVGAFFFDSEFGVTSIDGFFGATTVFHENEAWSLFAQTDYDVSDALTVTAGLRYTDDEKSFSVGDQNVDGFALVIGVASIQDIAPVSVDDSEVSWELSANYQVAESSSVYGRVAYGFRGPTIQGRDVAFEGNPSVADSETVLSYEVGFKSDLSDTLRLSGAAYYYQIDDIQFSAIGGGGNFNQLINAEEGTGMGFEFEGQWLVSDALTLTGAFSYNDTEINDGDLRVAPCGSGQCTVVDPVDANGSAFIDGNPFPQAPETTLNFTARYVVPVEGGEWFGYTDWAFQGETNIFLYDAVEYRTDNQFEAGLRVGYTNFDGDYTVALFGRNITDEENLRGGIDFNNLTAIDNQPRVWGVEFRKSFN